MEDMPFRDWYPCLVVAMEREELEHRRNYWGEPEEYTPLWAPELGPQVELLGPAHAGTTNPKVAHKVAALAATMRMPQGRHSVAALAEARPDKARAVFLDESGRVVDAEGAPLEVQAGAVVVDARGQLVGPSAAAQSPVASMEGILALFGMENK